MSTKKAKDAVKAWKPADVHEVKMTWVGTSPLIMHNVQLADPRNKYAREGKRLNKEKRAKNADQDEYLELLMRNEFLGGLYHSGLLKNPDNMGPYMPGFNMWSSLRAAAKLTRSGKAVEGGIMPLKGRIRLDYDGPRDVEELWEAQWYDARMVDVQGSMILRCRPKFEEWSVTATFQIDTGACSVEEAIRFAHAAGRYVGLGDARVIGMGRFDVEVHS